MGLCCTTQSGIKTPYKLLKININKTLVFHTKETDSRLTFRHNKDKLKSTSSHMSTQFTELVISFNSVLQQANGIKLLFQNINGVDHQLRSFDCTG
ncbi:hypothetical protein Hanom_Chr03g00220681 [Helianthus anomalus]